MKDIDRMMSNTGMMSIGGIMNIARPKFLPENRQAESYALNRCMVRSDTQLRSEDLRAQRLSESLSAMAEEWPHFRYRLLTYGELRVGSWRGPVQPLKKTNDLLDILDDINHDREVYLSGGAIGHLPGCIFDHCHHSWMDLLNNLSKEFELQIWYDGTSAAPRCWVLHPEILTWKHMWWDWSICDSLASESWTSDKQTVADAMPYFLLWLVKWMVYEAAGTWIGAEHESTPEYHLNIIRPGDPCWCRKGNQYRHCHREMDKRMAKPNSKDNSV